MRAVLEYPGLLFALLFLFSFLLLERARPSARYLRLTGRICGVSAVAILAAILLLNIARPGFIWHDEVNVVAVSAAYLHGEPIYHSLAAPDFYSLLYGPCTFLVYLPFLVGRTHPLLAIHLGMAVLELFNLFLLYRIIRTSLRASDAIALLPIATGLLVMLPSILVGTRGDPWLLCCLSLGLLAALRQRWLPAAALSGLCCGLALDFKVSVAPVVLLLLAILWRRHGVRAAVLSAATAICVAGALFLLPGISLPNYIVWLRLAERQHLLWSNLINNLAVALYLVLGAVLLRLLGTPAPGRRPAGLLVSLLSGLALAACILTGAKDGAGDWHLWPMLPVLLFWTAWEISGSEATDAVPTERASTVIAAISIAATLLTMRYGLRAAGAMGLHGGARQRAQQPLAEDEMDRLSGLYPGNLAMAYGSIAPDDRSNLRFELPLHGEDYFFDENAVVEATKEALAVPDRVAARVVGCSAVWLVPHGEVPFSTTRTGVLRDTSKPYLFPDSIRLGFLRTHTLKDAGPVYDIWTCPSQH